MLVNHVKPTIFHGLPHGLPRGQHGVCFNHPMGPEVWHSHVEWGKKPEFGSVNSDQLPMYIYTYIRVYIYIHVFIFIHIYIYTYVHNVPIQRGKRPQIWILTISTARKRSLFAEVCRNWRIQCYWDCVTKHIGPELSWNHILLRSEPAVFDLLRNQPNWSNPKADSEHDVGWLNMIECFSWFCTAPWSNQSCGLNPIEQDGFLWVYGDAIQRCEVMTMKLPWQNFVDLQESVLQLSMARWNTSTLNL